MRATITGATGHVGVTLARALRARGHSVRALVRGETRALDGLDVEQVSGDVTLPESLAPGFAGSEVVFHAAGRISITSHDVAEVRAVNVDGTANVIAACRAAGVRRLVHFSSIETLDPFPLESPVDEARPYVNGRAGSPYAASKARAESLVREAAAGGLDAVILNPTAIIGPFDVKPSLLGRAVMSLAEGRIPILVDGGFDWVDVRDVAEAAITAAERAPTGARYIIGGRWASMLELATIACEAAAAVTGHAAARPPSLLCPFWLASAGATVTAGISRFTGRKVLFTSYSLAVLRGNRSVSHEAARRDLGYSPRDLRDTVRDTVAWFTDRTAAAAG
jgi:dihydroflavonol-4-reductase